MQLSKNQIAKIKQRVSLNNERLIARIDVSEDKSLSPDERVQISIALILNTRLFGRLRKLKQSDLLTMTCLYILVKTTKMKLSLFVFQDLLIKSILRLVKLSKQDFVNSFCVFLWMLSNAKDEAFYEQDSEALKIYRHEAVLIYQEEGEL